MTPFPPCPFCISTLKPHYVHGHLQCSCCGLNIGECCSGEVGAPAAGSAYVPWVAPVEPPEAYAEESVMTESETIAPSVEIAVADAVAEPLLKPAFTPAEEALLDVVTEALERLAAHPPASEAMPMPVEIAAERVEPAENADQFSLF